MNIHEMTDEDVRRLRGDELRKAIALELGWKIYAVPYFYMQAKGKLIPALIAREEFVSYRIAEEEDLSQVIHTEVITEQLNADIVQAARCMPKLKSDWVASLDAAFELDSKGWVWSIKVCGDLDIVVCKAQWDDRFLPETVMLSTGAFESTQEALCVARCIAWLLARKRTRDNNSVSLTGQHLHGVTQ